MKVTVTELIVLLDALKGSLAVYDRVDIPLFTWDYETRKRVYENIVNRHGGTFVEIEEAQEEKR